MFGMLENVLASKSVSVSDLKKNPTAIIEAANGAPVAILNRNKPSAYLVPAAAWEEIIDRLEDIEIAALIRERANEVPIRVDLATV